MQVILEAVEGPASGTRLLVRQGQIVRIGRTAWDDYSLPDDGELAEVHFELEYAAEGCRLKTQGDAVTQVNGEDATEVWLKSGDQVTAGQTTFRVDVPQDATRAPAETSDATAGDAAGEPAEEAKPPETAVDFCERIKLSDDAHALLTDESMPAEFLQTLIEEELLPDALKFLACWLPKPDAVRWGCGCVRAVLEDDFNEKDTAAIEAAEAWADEPDEPQRRAAESAAKANDLKGPASWLAQAAFWSGGSLTGPDMTPVPPDEGLTARGVAAALSMAASHGQPGKAKQRYAMFLDQGKELTQPEAARAS